MTSGKNLSIATVKFNGKVATVLTNTSTIITARIPTGATSGPITVATPGGMASSAVR